MLIKRTERHARRGALVGALQGPSGGALDRRAFLRRSGLVAVRPPTDADVPRGPRLVTDDGEADARRARERELVLVAQRGDEGAFAALVRLHQQRAYAVARAIAAAAKEADVVRRVAWAAA